MIYPTRKSVTAQKSVKAVADFSATQSSKGKIVLDGAHNVQIDKSVNYAGAFIQKDDGVLQYLAVVDGEQAMLKEDGLNMGVRIFPQFVGCQRIAWAFDVNQSTLLATAAAATYKICNGTIQKVSDVIFDSVAICQSRVFGLLGNRLYLSSPTETTFSSDLWIDLPTSCNALVNSGELYALGNDVYKITVDGDESHVKITKICSNVGEIQADTVCAYGNKILFVANGKIMSLQQGSLKIVAELDCTPVCAAMHKGLYYLSLQKDGQSQIISYNPHNGKLVTIHCVSAKNIYSNGTGLLVSDGTNGFELTADAQSCYWKSQPINFDDQPNAKHLHRLVVQTSSELTVCINADTSRTYNLKGKDAVQSLLIVGHGKNITVELSSVGAMSVAYLSLTARPSEVSV